MYFLSCIYLQYIYKQGKKTFLIKKKREGIVEQELDKDKNSDRQTDRLADRATEINN